MKRKVISFLSLLLVVGVTLSGCGSSTPAQVAEATEPEKAAATAVPPTAAAEPTAAPTEAAPKVLVIGDSCSPDSLDAHQGEPCQAEQMYDSLLWWGPSGTEVLPNLAESWEVSDDGLIYTFRLRKGVSFHDGTPFNAEALKFSFDRQLDETSEYYGMGTWQTAQLVLRDVDISKVKVVDEYTLEVGLKNVTPAFPFKMTSLDVVSPEAVKEWREDYPSHPSGTGPFKLASWEKGVKLVMDRNKDYWKGPVPIDQIIVLPIPEALPRVSALQTGEVDLIFSVPADFVAGLEAAPGIEVLKRPACSLWSVHLNVKNVEAFKDVRVRQALNFAVDREAITEGVLSGMAVPAKGPYSPSWGEVSNIAYDPEYTYNPDKARELLKEAGYEDGFEVTLMVPQGGTDQQMPEPMAAVIQQNLADVGVNVELQTFEWGVHNERVFAGEYEMAIRAYNSPFIDPDFWLTNLWHTDRIPPAGIAGTFYSNPEYDEIVNKARSTVDDALRLALHKQAHAIIVRDAPYLFVDWGIAAVAYSDKFKGATWDIGLEHPSFSSAYFEE